MSALLTIAKPPRLVRPAIIEFRYRNFNKYKRQLQLYRRALRSSKPINLKDSTNSFSVGVLLHGMQEKDMELRFVCSRKPSFVGNNHTIIYWEVANEQGPAYDSIKVASNFLIDAANGFEVVEPLPPKTPAPNNNTYTTLLVDTTSGRVNTRELISAKAQDNNLVGLVINPAYPRLIKKKSYNPKKGNDSSISIPIPPATNSVIPLVSLSLLAGLLLGWGLSQFVQWLRASQRQAISPSPTI